MIPGMHECGIDMRVVLQSHFVWEWYCSDLREILLKACVVSAVIVYTVQAAFAVQEFSYEACWLC